MTKEKDFKQVIRKRMAETGERYTAARNNLGEAHEPLDPGRRRRILGIETRYRAVATVGGVELTADDTCRHLLGRRHDASGQARFLANGGRLSLVAPGIIEYATPECDRLDQLVAHVAAGERRLLELAQRLEHDLSSEGASAQIIVAPDRSPSGGCHESYLSERRIEPSLVTSLLVPFLVTRQIYAGAGGVFDTDRRSLFLLSPRAEHLWDALPSEHDRRQKVMLDPDAAALANERYRRIHVSVGDANRGQLATFLKVGTTSLVLRLLEQEEGFLPDLTLENPMRAVREVSHDVSGHRSVRLVSGRTATALAIQEAVLSAVQSRLGTEATQEEQHVLDLWRSSLDAIEHDRESLVGAVDWITRLNASKSLRQLLLRPQPEGPLWLSEADDLTSADCARQDVIGHNYCDVECQTVVPDDQVARAYWQPPQTTRAHLRGAFINTCTAAKRSYAVDWTHVGLNEPGQEAVVLDDPGTSSHPAAEQLMAEIASAHA